jgi:adenine-specific DNA-methyltransferase
MPFLDWVNKNQAKEATREVPYHLLKQEAVHGDVSAANADNLLIQGDNLLALKALVPFYAGRVKCIFIDPPYNTQSAFEHYDDKLEHSQWLSMMYPRLVLLRDLLAEDGSIWITVDDNESHYLKVMLDEVFGRSNFIANAVWQKKASPQANSIWLSDSHDHVLCFAKSKQTWRPNLLERTADADARYENLDNDPRGAWTSGDFTISLTGGQRGAQYARTGQSDNIFEITTPSGRKLMPTAGRCWGSNETRFKELVADGRIWFGESGNNVPRIKRFLSEVQDGMVCTTLWLRNEVGDNQGAKKEVMAFNSENVFSTPKPEGLLHRILNLATKSDDLVLDSFLGSGTTAAVAHKMGRRYIGIEMGEHARTHCLPRLQKVIEGEQGGISASVEWKGGGGFRFCILGDPAFDTDGRISNEVKFATLAAYVWHFETGQPGSQTFDSPLLGVHDGVAYYLLFNGILGDRKPAGGNVLTHDVLHAIKEVFPHSGPRVVYGEVSRLGAARLAAEGITFKQIPYDIKMR